MSNNLNRTKLTSLLTLSFILFGCVEQELASTDSKNAGNTPAESVEYSKASCRPEKTEIKMANRQRVFFLGSSQVRDGLYVSHDGGRTFDQSISRLPSRYFMSPSAPVAQYLGSGEWRGLAVSNRDHWYVATTEGLSISFNQGKSFRHVQFPAQVNGVQMNRMLSSVTILADSTLLVHAFDGIMHLAADGRVIRRMGLDQFAPGTTGIDSYSVDSEGRMVVVAWTRGTLITLSNGLRGSRRITSVYVSEDCGRTFAEQFRSASEVDDKLSAGVVHALDSGEIVVGNFYGVHLSRDGGRSFVAFAEDVNGTPLKLAGSFQLVGSVLYVGTANGLASVDLASAEPVFRMDQINSIGGYTYTEDNRAIGGELVQTVVPHNFTVQSLAYSETLGLIASNWGLIQSFDGSSFHSLSDVNTVGRLAGYVVIK